jgi:hypothetical protein
MRFIKPVATNWMKEGFSKYILKKEVQFNPFGPNYNQQEWMGESILAESLMFLQFGLWFCLSGLVQDTSVWKIYPREYEKNIRI